VPAAREIPASGDLMDSIREDYLATIHNQAKVLDVVIVGFSDLIGQQGSVESSPDALIYLHDLECGRNPNSRRGF
jgi:hypothetical protein